MVWETFDGRRDGHVAAGHRPALRLRGIELFEWVKRFWMATLLRLGTAAVRKGFRF